MLHVILCVDQVISRRIRAYGFDQGESGSDMVGDSAGSKDPHSARSEVMLSTSRGHQSLSSTRLRVVKTVSSVVKSLRLPKIHWAVISNGLGRAVGETPRKWGGAHRDRRRNRANVCGAPCRVREGQITSGNPAIRAYE
jgi:hypothetical protein